MKKGLSCIAIILSIVGCSTQKDRAINRTYHSTTTKFNVLFNGHEALQAGIDRLIDQQQDNFWEQLAPEPYTLRSIFDDNYRPDPMFERAEEKAVLAVQKHSMLIDGDQKNNQIDEAYMLLGKARYFDGRYLPAQEAFNYILTNLNPSDQVEEAQLWRAKIFLHLFQEDRAINELKSLVNNASLSIEDYAEANAALAKAYLINNQTNQAIQPINKAALLTKNKTLSARYTYLLGQIYDQLGLRDSASLAYQRVVDFNRAIPRKYWIHAKLSQLVTGMFPQLETEEMFYRLEKNQENKKYLDKIFYSQAVHSLRYQQIDVAETYFNKALRTDTSDEFLKALSYEALSELSFDRPNYVAAGAYLDSTLIALDNKSRKYRKIQRKREKLDDIIEYETTIKESDSLLVLMNKSPEELTQLFQTYIQDLKTLDAQKALAMKQQSVIKNTSFSGGNFYFYNSAELNQGRNDFFRLWGDIPLVDNWRSTNLRKNQVTENNIISTDTIAKTVNPRYELATYLGQIPPNEKMDSIIGIRNEAYYQAGLAYKEQFSEYRLAINRLEKLLTFNPEVNYSLPSMYHLYQAHRTIDSSKAMEYRNTILNQHPNSAFAKILSNPDEMAQIIANIEANLAVQDSLHLTQEFDKVIALTDSLLPVVQDKTVGAYLMLNKAKATGRLYGIEAYIKSLEEVATTYPNQEKGKWALTQIEPLKNLKPIEDASGEPKVIFIRNRQQQKETLEIKEELLHWAESLGLQNVLSFSLDIYDNNDEGLVIHGLSSINQAEEIRNLILQENKKLKNNRNFVVLGDQYRNMLIFKDFESL